MSNRTLAIIPARGGSKRIPNKNLKKIDGIPLIAHTIGDAEDVSSLDEVIVSTDDKTIATVAEEHGGTVPFIRPDHLATDLASTNDVITHALEWATEQHGRFEYVCLLQATSPLRTPEDIENTLNRLEETGAKSVVSISEFLSPPQWAVVEDEHEQLETYFDSAGLWDDEYARSQDFGNLYHPNGAVFAATTSAWNSFESFYTPETVGYEMPPERSFDIDDPWELDLVRKLMGC